MVGHRRSKVAGGQLLSSYGNTCLVSVDTLNSLESRLDLGRSN